MSHRALYVAVFFMFVCTLGDCEHQVIGVGTSACLGDTCVRTNDKVEVEVYFSPFQGN